jgi:CRISPR-associated endonuclease Csn1
LWDQARTNLAELVVSHRTLRKVAGPLHMETPLGDTGQDITENGVTYRRYVTRKSLQGITKSQIGDIRDPEIRRLVEEHVTSHGGDPKKAFPPFPQLSNRKGTPRAIRKVRIVVKRRPELVVPLRARNGSYADAGENHHMAIFRHVDGQVRFETVSRFEAARRVARGEPAVRRSADNGWQFVMSLAPGDTLAFPEADGDIAYRRVTSVWAAGQVVLQDGTEAADTVWKRPNAASIVAMGAYKVAVDPIGRVRPSSD